MKRHKVSAAEELCLILLFIFLNQYNKQLKIITFYFLQIKDCGVILKWNKFHSNCIIIIYYSIILVS